MGRDLMNNPKMRDEASRMAAEENILSCIKVSDKANATYDLDDFNRGMLWAVTLGSSVGSVASAVRGRIEDVIGAQTNHRASPTDEWFNGVLSKTDKNELMDGFARSARLQMDVARDLGQMSGDGMVIAIDMHLIPRWDKKRDSDLTRSKRKNGTGTFERYATAQCVEGGPRLVLGAMHMGAFGFVPRSVRSLVEECRHAGANVKAALLDREFFSADVFAVFDELGTGYIVPCKNTDPVVSALDDFAAGRRPAVSEMHITNADGVSVKYTMIITERKKKSRKGGESEDLPPKEKFIGFATNMPQADAELYSKRWGIETGYRMIENMRAKTCSKHTAARIFCFLYSVVMFNAWVTINMLMSATSKPAGKGKRRMTQTQLKVNLTFVLARHGPDPGEPPDPDYLPLY